MKAPEEYLPRSEPTLRKFKDGTEDIIYVPRYVAINSLKSMQEDHEKELIEAIEFVEKKATDGANEMVKRLGLLGRVTPTPTQDLLTQFRNKQQDR